MSPQTLNIQINIASLQSTFFRLLQHQLDITKILQAGCDIVTAEQVIARKEFGSFIPANGAQLSHEKGKIEAHDWLLRGFLRDAIEGTGLFLDECLYICAWMKLISLGETSATKINQTINELQSANHRLYLPQKIQKLKREFNLSSRFNSHVLSLNRARTCVVHRLGVVSALDVDETQILNLTLQSAKFIARSEQSGLEQLIDKSGTIILEESMLELHFVDKHLTFNLGEKICLQPEELYDTIITLWRFGLTIAQAIESYGSSLGLKFKSND